MEAVINALKHRYAKNESESGNTDSAAVVAFLSDLIEFPNQETLMSLLRKQRPDWVLPTELKSILACVDDCCVLIFRLADMVPDIEAQLRLAIPQIACRIIETPDLPVTAPPTLLTLLDHLNEGLVGWIPGLGAAGDTLEKKLLETMQLIQHSDAEIAKIEQDVSKFMTREANRIVKLEQRLAASESGLLRSQQSKILSARMINKATRNKELPESIVTFLQGPWFDSAQLLISKTGLASEAWQRATKLTETIVWTYQPVDEESETAPAEKQRLYRIIEQLRNEIEQSLVSLEHDAPALEQALEQIESDHVTIMSNQKLEFSDFEPIPDDQRSDKGSRVSRLLLRRVHAMETGQWFTYLENDISIRIKLVLKLDDIEQLLFTNRNGMKVLQKSFDEFAYHLSSQIVKPLNHEAVFSSTFRTHYDGLMAEYEKYQKLLVERSEAVARLDQERKEARKKALKEARRLVLAKQEAVKERQLAEEAAAAQSADPQDIDQITALTRRVKRLSVGAHLNLPGQDGTLSACKLAVKISGVDRMIFVNSTGVKAGQYDTNQLVQLLVAGQAEISDDGGVFEDTLAQVVSRLRQDRNKSYDELTKE